MAVFSYEALDENGHKRKGVLEADTPRLLRQQLRTQGLSPVTVLPAQEKAETSRRPVIRGRKVSGRDIALFTRQLSTMVGAAIPIEEALESLARQTVKPHLKTLITSLRSRVLEGQSLADSMAAYPRVFDPLFRAMVAAGEKSGTLDTVLERLADYNEQRQRVRNKLVQALIYPVVLTLVAVAVVGALLATVVPTVVEQFDHMNQELPAITRTLIALSDFVRIYGVYVVLVVLVVLVVRHRLLQHAKRRLAYDRVLLRLPVIASVVSAVDSARYARTLSILASSHIPLLEGMSIAGDVVLNTYVRQVLGQAAERVREGSALWAALDKSGFFPPMMLHIIATGERSSELEVMLGKAADIQEQQLEDQINIALSIFTPALILVMAAMVLFIVMAILTPMLDLNSLMAG